MAAPESSSNAASPQRTPSRRLVWLVAAIVLVAIVVGAWMWLRKPAEPSGPPGRGSDAGGRPLPVVAAPVTKGAIDVYINALGTVTPRNMVTVHSRVDGQLMRVAFREGQVVKAGRAAGRDRSAPLRGAAHPGAGTDGQGSGAAQERPARPRALPDTAFAGLDLQAAGRHAGISRAPVPGRRASRSGPDRQREFAADLFTRDRADQRCRGPASGRSRQRDTRERCERTGRHHADPADHRAVPDSGGQSAAGARPHEVGRDARGRGL